MGAVGEEIDSLCGRCGESTLHVVIALAGGRVAQVECRRCGARHRHRGASPAPRSATTRRAAPRRLRAAKPLVDPDLDRPVRPYRASDSYAPADRIEHPSFGIGVVERLTGPGKIQVFFEAGQKVLIHARR